MGVTISSQGPKACIVFSGRLDELSANKLQDILSGFAGSAPLKCLEMNLGQVTSINSSALGVMLKFVREHPSVDVHLTNTPNQIYDMLKTVKLDKIFTISKNKS